MRRWPLLTATGVVLAGVVTGVLVTNSRGSASTRPLIVTAEAQRRTLQDKVTLTGQLSRVLQRNVSAASAAQVSQVQAKSGDIVQAGQAILALNGRDAIAETGTFSFFRNLGVGDKGEDVRQLDQILASAGYNPGPISTLFTAQTQFALAQWQAAHGYPGAAPQKAETVTVSLTQGTGYKVGARSTAGLVIGPAVTTAAVTETPGPAVQLASFRMDSPTTSTSTTAPPPAPVFTIQSVNAVTPKGSPAAFAVYASSSTPTPISFAVSLGGDAGPSDVLPPVAPLVMPAGATATEFQVPTRSNGLVEPDRTLTVSLQAQNGYAVGTPGSASTRITSADVPQITITGSIAVADGQPATLTLAADQAPVQDTQLVLNVGGTASPNKDYTPIGPTVTLPAGQTSVTVTLQTLADNTIEPDKQIVVAVGQGVGYKVGPINTATVTLLGATGDAALPVVTLQSATTHLAKGQPFPVTVSLSQAISQPLTIQLAYGGSAQPLIDYTAPGGQIVVPAGQTSLQVQVPTIQDNLVEPDRTLSVTLAPTSAYKIGAPASVSTVITDQNLPELSIVAGTGSLAEGQGTSFLIAADQAPAKDTSVNFQIVGTAQPGQDYQPIVGTALLPAGQTSVRVPLLSIRKDVLFQPTDMITGQWPIRVGQVLVKQGDLAAPGTPLFTLTDTAFTVTLTASASDRTKLKLGQHVTVKLSGGNTQSDGVISQLDDNVTVDDKTQAQTYKGKINVVGALGAADGATVTIDVVLDSATNVLTVPIAAVKQNGDGHDVVRVIDLGNGAHVTEVPVETGVSDDSYIEIRTGLKGGEVVVVETDTTKG
jgi:multidrug efflux pump subunit AcrA (membrane-fusion protein)